MNIGEFFLKSITSESIIYSIIIPCYNEEDNVSILIDNICSNTYLNCEIVLVDNGSTDNTSKKIKQILSRKKNENIKLLSLKSNLGYGGGILAGLESSQGSIIAWTHADLQTDIKDVYRGFDYLKERNIKDNFFIKGKRLNRPFIDTFMSFTMGIISSIILKSKLMEINAQPKIFNKSLIVEATNPPLDFSLDLYFYYISKKLKKEIIEIPVFFMPRVHGIAKGGGGSSLKVRMRLILRTLRYIFSLARRVKLDNKINGNN